MTTETTLAIGVDSAEPELVRALIAAGELPSMASLAEGGWTRVDSAATIGSGAVWPGFITGLSAQKHGIHSEWQWNPSSMSLRRTRIHELRPFWRSLREAGVRVGVMDVPFAPFDEEASGFEICEWGAHDRLEGRTRLSPHVSVPVHPFSTDDEFASGAAGIAGKSVAGVRLRGATAAQLLEEKAVDLGIIVFTEFHHAAHSLWDRTDEALQKGLNAGTVSPLADVLREIDAQIPLLTAAAGGTPRVLLFSLHGMRGTGGVPQLLERFLVDHGYARYAEWGAQSWSDHLRSFFGSAKRRAPAWAKQLYYRTMPPAATHRLAQATMLPQYDWHRTRAFSLPTDQHGWIRINLRGREWHGLVPEVEYAGVRDEIAAALRGLRAADGTPLVRDIVATAPDGATASRMLLPDLVVHWTAAAEQPPYVPTQRRKVLTGQHAPHGFALSRGIELPVVSSAEALSRFLMRAVGVTLPDG